MTMKRKTFTDVWPPNYSNKEDLDAHHGLYHFLNSYLKGWNNNVNLEFTFSSSGHIWMPSYGARVSFLHYLVGAYNYGATPVCYMTTSVVYDDNNFYCLIEMKNSQLAVVFTQVIMFLTFSDGTQALYTTPTSLTNGGDAEKSARWYISATYTNDQSHIFAFFSKAPRKDVALCPLMLSGVTEKGTAGAKSEIAYYISGISDDTWLNAGVGGVGIHGNVYFGNGNYCFLCNDVVDEEVTA